MQEIYRTQGERGGREYRRYIEDSGREGTGRMEVHETGREEEVCRRQRERERELDLELELENFIFQGL